MDVYDSEILIIPVFYLSHGEKNLWWIVKDLGEAKRIWKDLLCKPGRV